LADGAWRCGRLLYWATLEIGASDPYCLVAKHLPAIQPWPGTKVPQAEELRAPRAPTERLRRRTSISGIRRQQSSAGLPAALSATSRLRFAPGRRMRNSTLIKNDKVGPDGKYQPSVPAGFYNLFNRHYYSIQGGAGTRAGIGDSNFVRFLAFRTIRERTICDPAGLLAICFWRMICVVLAGQGLELLPRKYDDETKSQGSQKAMNW